MYKEDEQRYPHVLNVFSLDGIVEYIKVGGHSNILPSYWWKSYRRLMDLPNTDLIIYQPELGVVGNIY